MGWRHLYVAGRLHKPVKLVTPVKNISNQYDLSISRPDNDQILSPALQYNLTSALRIASLLNFNEKTSFDELIYTICNLSYTGDIRKKGFESTSKVESIFEGSYEYLQQLYLPVIEQSDWLQTASDGGLYQDTSHESKQTHLENLPVEINSNFAINNEIARIVSTSSKSQTWVNFWTA